jgi:hypothetical protein
MERTVQLKSVINSNGVDAVDGKGIELIDEAIFLIGYRLHFR